MILLHQQIRNQLHNFGNLRCRRNDVYRCFYWRVVVKMRQSVAQDNEWSQQGSEGTIRKELLLRAFWLISASYIVFYLPLTVAFPVRAYFQQTFKRTPVPVGEQINYDHIIGCVE